jgi:uncharacterized protein (DUF2141 family)
MRARHVGQLLLAMAMLLGGVVATRAQAPATTDAGKLKVTVEYKGQSGTVDKNHKIWIWLFDTPTIAPPYSPIATGWLTENKASYKFSDLPKTVYVVAAFDDKGGYDGTSEPPATGTPVIVHGGTGPGTSAVAVATGGDDTAVTVTFDDTVRMP